MLASGRVEKKKFLRTARGSADVQTVRSRVFVCYLVVQAALISGFLFVRHGSTLGVFWQVAVGWLATAFALRGILARPLRAELVRILLATGIFLNTSGILVQYLEDKLARPMISPHPADAFWLALYPCVIAALAVMVGRRSADDGSARLARSTVLSTAITIVMGVVAWQLVIVPQSISGSLSLTAFLLTISYPMGDLIFVALLLRLLLRRRSPRGGALWFMTLSIACMLIADTAWVIPLRSGWPLSAFDTHLLQATSILALASMGAAAGHGAFNQAAPPAHGRPSVALLVSVAVTILVAPTVFGFEALLKEFSDRLT